VIIQFSRVSVSQGRLSVARDASPISLNLFKVVFPYNPHKTVILRACDFFDLFAFFAPDQIFFSPLEKGVILSEAPPRSIA
jgi:hypothetical protein